MAIEALPRATSHFLGSSQVLSSPTALVKELLDNALDAKATSIDIIVSANILDKVEVRDNGHGIAPEDLDVLGRRGYTSKLRKFDELKTIGGLSLGFRGEALASAAELGQVSIITRTEGEIVATAVKLKAYGGLETRHSTSHPVGTTVCIVNFLSKLPVRKKNVLKDAKKHLSQIKDLLQSYALARLNIRLSLRVLKAEKSNWSFAPRPKDAIRDIVSQVISRDVTAQCMEKISGILPSAEIQAHGQEYMSIFNQPQHTTFIFQAFLPKPEADLSKIAGGQYVSVDSRPVSCARGTLKKIVTVYKNLINGITTRANLSKVKEPFLRLNIICPVASYDPNIEPAKDNVLFEDESLLLSLAEQWFESIYGSHNRSMELSLKEGNASFKAADVSQARCKMTPHLDMSKDYTEDIEPTELVVRGSCHQLSNPNVVQTRPDALNGLDPWVIAKLNAPLAEKRSKGIDLSNSKELPRNKNFSTMPPKHCRTNNSTTSHLSSESNHLPYVVSSALEGAVGTDPLQSSIDSWLASGSVMHVHGREICPPSMPPLPARVGHNGTSENYDRIVTAGAMGRCLPWSPPTTQERILPIQPTGPRKNFVSPLTTSRPTFLQLPSIPADMPKSLSSRHLQHNKDLPGVISNTEEHEYSREAPLNLHVEEALDFERRKEIATLKLRAELRQSRTSSGVSLRQTNGTIRSSPHSNSHQGAFALTSLDTSQRVLVKGLVTDIVPAETSLHDSDPRAYLMRRHQSIAVQADTAVVKPNLKRAKTIMLPLETTPTYMELHNLLQSMKVDVDHIRKAALTLTSHDEYTTSGKMFRGVKNVTADFTGIEKRMRNMMKMWMQVTGHEEEVQYDLEGAGEEKAGMADHTR